MYTYGMDDARYNQMADDLHLIATPFRLLRELLIIGIGILCAPALLVLFLIGATPNDVGIPKFVIGVFGPLVFCIWFAGIVRWLERRNEKYPAPGLGASRTSGLAAYFCGVGYIGVLASQCFGLSGLPSLWAMVLGLFSPAILYVIGRSIRNA